MPLSNSTKNWMMSPYPVDMATLKDIAKKEAAAIIDGLHNDAEIHLLLNTIGIADEYIIRDRDTLRVLTPFHAADETAK